MHKFFLLSNRFQFFFLPNISENLFSAVDIIQQKTKWIAHLYLQREKQELAGRLCTWQSLRRSAIQSRCCHSYKTMICLCMFLCHRMRSYHFPALLRGSKSQECCTGWIRYCDLSKKSSKNPFDEGYEWPRLYIPISGTAYRILIDQWWQWRDQLRLHTLLLQGNFRPLRIHLH